MAINIEVRGKIIAGGKLPLICAPLTGKNQALVLDELTGVLGKGPDLVEWRVDFFEHITNVQEVMQTAVSIRQTAGDIPVLFTIRSAKEGGQPIALSEKQVVDLYAAVCRSKSIDLIDFELSNPREQIHNLRKITSENAVKLILSYHNFEFTPGPESISLKFREAERLGADIAKAAVMPKKLEDVLTLLSLTLEARDQLQIPVISIAMGEYGSLTRMFGWVFGSVVTFAVAENSSAPGQVPIEDLKTVLAVTQKGLGQSACYSSKQSHGN
ncbi:MAG: type I 3-dehydroquinate dehydratase [Desulfitobacteriaceae bacterium]|nr:type I 3-dehydroquinate dehydratase [Desulfitobacteriaceae bacterium]MDD4346100.1 type I 3-dehydroquinate dehydratase [Desulfitobacteriaceae bacterium]MDD4400885.1 type I 3-dehydroquinate dehydratase [Desulfitobacteriaceae bacterium]